LALQQGGEEVEKLDERIGFTKSTTAQQAPPNAETIDIERKMSTSSNRAESCSIMLDQSISNDASKNSLIEKLWKNLNDAETVLKLSKEKDNILEEQLHVTKRELEESKVQQAKQKDKYEERLRYQKMHIMRLRKQLRSEKEVSKKVNHKNMAISDLENRLRQCKRELSLATKCKTESKKDNAKCHKEMDKLLMENKAMKKRLMQYENDVEELERKNFEIIQENKTMNQKEFLQMKLLDADEFFHNKLNDERLRFIEYIEEYREYCEKLESKCLFYERTLCKSLKELKLTRNELDNSSTSMQKNVDRLLREKELLKSALNAKVETLHGLEQSNKKLARKLKQIENDVGRNYIKLDVLFHEKCDLVEMLQEKIKVLEIQSSKQHDREMASTEADQLENDTKTGNFRRKQIERKGKKENFVDGNVIGSNGGSVKDSASRCKDEIRDIQETLHGVQEEKASFEKQLYELRSDLKLKDKDISHKKKAMEDFKMRNKPKNLDENTEFGTLNDLLEQSMGGFEMGFREVNASCEEGRDELNEKLIRVLEITDETKDKCIKLEELLGKKEFFITNLQATMEGKQNEQEKQANGGELNDDALEGEHSSNDRSCATASTIRTCLQKDLKEPRTAEDDAATTSKSIVDDSSGDTKQGMELYEHKMKLGISLGETEDRSGVVNIWDRQFSTLHRESELATERAKILEMKIESLEELKKDLKLKKEEQVNSRTKKNKLFTQFHGDNEHSQNTEAKCMDFEADYKGSAQIQIESDQETNDFVYNDEVDVIIERLFVDNDALVKENESLRRIIEDNEKWISSTNSKRTLEKLQDMEDTIENMKQREFKLQKHNYELKKRIDNEEDILNILKENMQSIGRELEIYKNRGIFQEPDAMKLITEVEEWLKRLDDIISTLPDQDLNTQSTGNTSLRKTGALGEENKSLEEKLEKANCVIMEKENEIVLLEGEIENYQELLSIADERNTEIEAMKKQLEDANKQNSYLVAEIKHLERKIRELEENVDIHEKEINELQQVQIGVDYTSNKVCGDAQASTDDEEVLEANCEGCQDTIDQNNKMEEAAATKNYASGGRVSVDDYESDFYTDDDDKNNCNESIIKTKTSVTSEKESIVEDLQVQSDISDDFWNTVGDEQSLENISFFERIGESTGGERNRRTIDQENEKGSEVIAEEDDDSNATPVDTGHSDSQFTNIEAQGNCNSRVIDENIANYKNRGKTNNKTFKLPFR